ncbi:MAG: hypothetical protein R6U50_18150 [Desulfobacterales bacterium]
MRRTLLCAAAFMSFCILSEPNADYKKLRRLDHYFEVENYERQGNGFIIEVSNKSKQGFADFTVIFNGYNVNRVHIYRRETIVDFMEGKSERTFFLPGYDKRVFRIEIEVYDKSPVPKGY